MKFTHFSNGKSDKNLKDEWNFNNVYDRKKNDAKKGVKSQESIQRSDSKKSIKKTYIFEEIKDSEASNPIGNLNSVN